jgi:hypothetical protein
VHERRESVLKAALDLLPFLVFFPSLLYWGATSDIALKKYPLLMVWRTLASPPLNLCQLIFHVVCY